MRRYRQVLHALLAAQRLAPSYWLIAESVYHRIYRIVLSWKTYGRNGSLPISGQKWQVRGGRQAHARLFRRTVYRSRADVPSRITISQ